VTLRRAGEIAELALRHADRVVRAAQITPPVELRGVPPNEILHDRGLALKGRQGAAQIAHRFSG